jgi:hypothetical protein
MVLILAVSKREFVAARVREQNHLPQTTGKRNFARDNNIRLPLPKPPPEPLHHCSLQHAPVPSQEISPGNVSPAH